jgi:uncharacterized membrane protein
MMMSWLVAQLSPLLLLPCCLHAPLPPSSMVTLPMLMAYLCSLPPYVVLSLSLSLDRVPTADSLKSALLSRKIKYRSCTMTIKEQLWQTIQKHILIQFALDNPNNKLSPLSHNFFAERIIST